ncbi:Uncharacterized protein BP5553_03641 [Venustampulla echinocandica]|uniref:Uncharacterized protein n=1 Tax=Venustampulla echinocandica TaxID=2656787 RepID=A0A370TUV0_9HELO|nr:Uncharacterized protein BP5553_03641 [Venustampulla echinocandica]RDL39301.1 Uncharacterized protein BP5553_03641 [Venustampulla echinocandica]
MTYNPLTIGWANGATSVVSSRFAYGLSLPQPYEEAEYTLLKGTATNSTHWTLTAKCSGCTSYIGNDGSLTVLNGTGTAYFAWAQGGSSVQEPANNQSAFNIHNQYGKWTHNLNAARSSKFADWVAANRLEDAPTTTSSPVTTVPATATETTSTKTTLETSPAPSATNGAIPASCSASAPKYPYKLATGWKATKVLGGLRTPRAVISDTLGSLLIVESGKGISVHTISADGCTGATKMLISQTNLNHGIQLSPDGKTLYASSMTQVYQWTYDAASQSVQGSSTIIVKGMYNGGHPTRTLVLAPHQPNLLVISLGSNANWDYDSGNPNTGRALIRAFDLNAIPSGGYDYITGGYLMGYGLRNEIALTFDGNNMLWGSENSGDEFQRTPLGQNTQIDVHSDNPAEKLNFIGDVTKPNNNWYGYPTCFTVWEPSLFTDTKFSVGDQFVVSPNATFNDATCREKVTLPAMGYQAHSAPIDHKFDSTYSNLFVSFHGSWNRPTPTGYKLVAVPFTKGSDGAYKPVAPLNSNTGYQDIMWNPDLTVCTTACFRPAGLMFDKVGRLYMTSDAPGEGELWVLGQS